MRRKKLHHWLYQPIAFLHLRYIQYLYKQMTVSNYHNQTNMLLAKLELLQAKEEYYKSCFDCWGMFHPSCVSTDRHQRIMQWLFPVKDFNELCIVKWHSDEAITYFRNMLYLHNVPMPYWNSSVSGPGDYDFAHFEWHRGNAQVLDAVNNIKYSRSKAKKK